MAQGMRVRKNVHPRSVRMRCCCLRIFRLLGWSQGCSISTCGRLTVLLGQRKKKKKSNTHVLLVRAGWQSRNSKAWMHSLITHSLCVCACVCVRAHAYLPPHLTSWALGGPTAVYGVGSQAFVLEEWTHQESLLKSGSRGSSRPVLHHP